MKRLIVAAAAAIGIASGAWAKTIYELSTDYSYLVNTPLADGDVITGTLSEKVNIRIANNATVTIRNVTIQCKVDDAYDTKNKLDYAGLTCLGNATIILEGANTIYGFYIDNPGIFVPETCTLTIKGIGSLFAGSAAFGAGIGAGFNKPCGNIRIEGGTITAKGGMGAAGIGAAHGGKCGNIIITGGNVAATTSSQVGDGYLRHESVNFSGAAGIGSADISQCGDISISGGNVTAKGGQRAAAIGSGNWPACGTITISGGTINATAGRYDSGAGIGTGSGTCGNISITGGKINAWGGPDSAGIGTGSGSCGTITISSGIFGITAVRGNLAPNPIGKGKDGSCGTVTIASGIPKLISKKRSSSESGTMQILKTCDLSMLADEDLTIPHGMTLRGAGCGPKISIAAGATVTLDNARIEGMNSNTRKWAGLTCEGNATIVLVGQNNYVHGYYEEYPGIFVPSGKTLTIQGTGALEASSRCGAGIGGGYNINCGNILIKDGWITATGGDGCPGIGGGDNAACGTITVDSAFSGLIAATAGKNCSNQIGAGADGGTCGTITIPGNLHDFTKGSTRYISPGKKIDLSTLTGGTEIKGGDVLTGTLAGNYKLTIADGAMVTLSDATIKGINNSSCKWAGLTCLGDATIVLEGTNTVRGFHQNYPGIHVPYGKTLTIQGGGSLDASSNGFGAGIGGGSGIYCGNIVIESGTITARGGKLAAGIGSGSGDSSGLAFCGDISILGGTVIATGGGSSVPVVTANSTQLTLGGTIAAGIGTGNKGYCGDITIGEGVDSVIAVGGNLFGSSPIGAANDDATCGNITVADGLSDTTSDSGSMRTIIQGDLSKLKGDRTFGDTAVLTGMLNSNFKVSIAHRAKVTLRNVTITGYEFSGYSNLEWAGITCEGDATIILEGVNYVRGFEFYFPGIFVPTNGTLTIKGGGYLEARSGGSSVSAEGAGIGGGNNREGHVLDCGNIVIWGGTIDAVGGKWAAGIGGGSFNSCGNIYINGGTITATGGTLGPGIGDGNCGTCGTIALLGGTVTATGGGGSSASGIGGSGCAGVEIGGYISRVTATGGDDSTPIRCKSTGKVTVAAGLNDSTEGNTRTIASGDLAMVRSDLKFLDGETISGTLKGNYKISIADGATVTLKDVTIEGENTEFYKWAGITCEGDATIILEGVNVLKGFYEDYPGIYVPPGKTLTIKGDGSLDASSNGYGTGIGGGWKINGGNIVIAGGIISATGGADGAAGIGGGYYASCGDITIEKGAMFVMAEGGDGASYSVGSGTSGSCGTVTVDGEVVGPISANPYIYPALDAGVYFKATLAELGYDVPTDGTPYSVTALGLPAGLKLKYNAAVKNKKGKVVTKAKSTWWIEGVPTAGLDFMTNPSYLVITANGKTVTVPLALPVNAQTVTELLPELTVGDKVEKVGWLTGVGTGWAVTGLPTGLKYTAKAIKKSKIPADCVYGTVQKAGLFTVTAKKKTGAFYETKKFKVLVWPKAADAAVFGPLANQSSVAYTTAVNWDLTTDVASVGGKVAKVTGLPPGLTFAASTTYKDKKKTQVKQQGQTIVGTPTKAGTYAVTFTKNVKSGKKTVAKTAQILWTVAPNATKPELTFNTKGAKVVECSIGLKYDGADKLLAFKQKTSAPNATVTASGMPKGIKLVETGDGDYEFQGYATKAGTYLVTVKATVNGNTVTQRVVLKVNALPAWAKGSYNGYVETNDKGDHDAFTGLATFSVTSAGKISGKFTEFGTNWTFSAACFEEAGNSIFYAPVTAKYAYKVKEKKKTVTKYVMRDFKFYVYDYGLSLGGAAVLKPVGAGNVTSAQCQQNLWGSTYKTIGSKLFYTSKKAKYRVYSVNGEYNGRKWTLSIKVTPNGKAVATMTIDTGKKKKGKIVYYKASCSTVVMQYAEPDTEPTKFMGVVSIYLAPSAKNNFPGLGMPMYIIGTNIW